MRWMALGFMSSVLVGCASTPPLSYLDRVTTQVSSAVGRDMSHPGPRSLAGSWLNFEGSAVALMTVLKDGNVDKVRIKRSSGKPEIDQAIIKAIWDSSPFPPPPLPRGAIQEEFQIKIAFGKMPKPSAP